MTKEKLTSEQMPDAQQVGRTAIAAEASTYEAVGQKIHAAKAAMAEKFGVNEEDFVVVVSENDVERKAVLVYAAPDGLLKGSWDDIFSSDEEYKVVVNGESVDTRAGMTYETYQGMTKGLSQGNETDLRFDTWLTGEAIEHHGVGGELAYIASNAGGSPALITGYAKSDREDAVTMRAFRPSLVIYPETAPQLF